MSLNLYCNLLYDEQPVIGLPCFIVGVHFFIEDAEVEPYFFNTSQYVKW
jgi:hypothetical protein